MRYRLPALCTVILLLSGLVVPSPASSHALSLRALVDEPPEPGSGVLEDPLTARGAVGAGFSATGRNSAQFTPEGWHLRVTGRTTETTTTAVFGERIARLDFPDGEVRAEFQFGTGAERARFLMDIRSPSTVDFYRAAVDANGSAQISRVVSRQSSVLTRRTDLSDLLQASEWKSIAFRAQGPNLWLLINEQLVLSATDSAFQSGAVYLGLQRLGNTDDADEASILVRNLRVSSLASGGEAQMPVYEPPVAAQASAPRSAPGEFIPPVGTPPQPASVVAEDPLTTNRMMSTGTCPTGNNSTRSSDEGRVVTVKGRCGEQDSAAQTWSFIPGLMIRDGEIAFEVRTVTGDERAEIVVFIRTGETLDNSYAFWWDPATGVGAVGRNFEGGFNTFSRRSDLSRFYLRDEWNAIAVRAQGPHLWLVVNGQPVVSAVDETFDSGRVAVRLHRLGDPNDDYETAVILRNLRVSALDGSDEAAGPTYDPSQSPALRASPPSGPVLAASPAPAIGQVIVEDPLNSRGAVMDGFCATGRNRSEFRDEGLWLYVTGPCGEETASLIGSRVEGLTFRDGEIQVEVRFADGVERASFGVATRVGADGSNYTAEIMPGLGRAVLFRTVDRQPRALVQRADLAPTLQTGDWMRLAIRAEGTNLWLLLNDVPMLSATDSGFDAGSVFLGLARLGERLDEQPASAIVRNLRVSALADGDPARVPVVPERREAPLPLGV